MNTFCPSHLTPQHAYELIQRQVQRECQVFGASAVAAQGPRRSGTCWWSPLVADVLVVPKLKRMA